MPNIIIVGAQWGDEGKGKIVDFLTEKADVVVRPQGGNNAGHTVIHGGKKYVLHLIPSGILWPGKLCVIGNGVVLDPVSLLQEMDGLKAQGIAVTSDNLKLSDRAHLVLPYHRGLDQRREALLGNNKIGTTGRGIGPAYADKIERRGFRLSDLNDPVEFSQRLTARLEECNALLAAAGVAPLSLEETGRTYLDAWRRLQPHVTDTASLLHSELASGKSLLFEGAQGTYLDIDHGTYPFVTSSNTTAGGALTGSGVSPRRIDRVVGVCKAYTTRVGGGPFTTENEALSDRLHHMGREFGATTGRPRRCGWLDMVLVRYASILSGFDDLAVTNLDGLDDLDEVQLCTAYELDGSRIAAPPPDVAALERCRPVYETHPGWKTSLSAIRKFGDLPKAARAYLDRMAELAGARISLVGVGPDREQTLEAQG
ncbi:MAG: adenylosuccinate synthase [Verrucomicrobiales bacterium]|nr:adenylosuccinate synthase [Verrucomicrobiales bacterium]